MYGFVAVNARTVSRGRDVKLSDGRQWGGNAIGRGRGVLCSCYRNHITMHGYAERANEAVNPMIMPCSYTHFFAMIILRYFTTFTHTICIHKPVYILLNGVNTISMTLFITGCHSVDSRNLSCHNYPEKCPIHKNHPNSHSLYTIQYVHLLVWTEPTHNT